MLIVCVGASMRAEKPSIRPLGSRRGRSIPAARNDAAAESRTSARKELNARNNRGPGQGASLHAEQIRRCIPARARWNQSPRYRPPPRAGCIPAHTGEHSSPPSASPNWPMHPRARWNPLDQVWPPHGCILTRAGEPRTTKAAPEDGWVHPRARGETAPQGIKSGGWCGASSRSGRNRTKETRCDVAAKCILACGEESRGPRRRPPAYRVHPCAQGNPLS